MLRQRRSTGFRLQSAGVVQFKKDYLDIPFPRSAVHGTAVASGGAASRPPTLLESHSHLILHLRYQYTRPVQFIIPLCLTAVLLF